MRLSQQTEWIVIAVLIAYLSFTSGLQPVKTLLASPVGKAAALAGIVYVWKYVSPVIALLLLIGFCRCCGSSSVWEGLEGSSADGGCKCPTGYLYDAGSKKCKNAAGTSKSPDYCSCPSGYAWDSMANECKPVSQETPPVQAVTAENSSAAPAVSSGPITSSAPMTTPGAAQDAVASMSTSTQNSGGVQPSVKTEGFSPY